MAKLPFKKISIGVALLGLFSASASHDKHSFTVSSETETQIWGNVSPIKLAYESTRVYLEDFFLSPNKIDSVNLPQTLTYVRQSNTLLVKGTLTNSMDVATFWIDGNAYHIPLVRSKKQAYTFTFADKTKKHQAVTIAGSLNGWVNNSDSLTYNAKTQQWEKTFLLNPAEYEYHLWIDGKEQTDPNNPQQKSNGMGGINSIFTVGNAATSTPITSAVSHTKKSIKVTYSDSIMAFWNNHLIPAQVITWNAGTAIIPIPSNSVDNGRNHMRVYAFNTDQQGTDLLIPFSGNQVIINSEDLNRTDHHTNSMYFMMVDRFMDGDSTNNRPVKDPQIDARVNFYGGDIAGVNNQINQHYFSRLGVNTIWMSPIGKNPDDAWGLWTKSEPETKFSGYHGYWPAQSKAIDSRFGTDAQLDTLIENAHNQNINVLLDYVANHIHISHPVYKQHPDWVTSLYLPDGRKNTELWDEQRLTTWFDDFLPTLNLENPAAAAAMSDSAMYWFKRFNIDGFRHDATKHIPNSFWRLLTHKLKHQVVVPQNRAIYQIGETYGNPELIDSYINSGMLNGQFDFNLYDQAVQAFAKNNTSFEPLANTLQQSISNYGSHHLMGNISGNQDRARFISYADGSVKFEEDAKVAGWTRNITNADTLGYNKLAMLHAFNFAITGIPVIYYGDEIGLAGANDPDNRRWMQFDNLNAHQAKLKQQVTDLAHLRSQNMALTHGQTTIIEATEELLIIERQYFDNTVIAVFNKSTKSTKITLPNIGLKTARSSFNHPLSLSPNAQITLPAFSFDYIIVTP